MKNLFKLTLLATLSFSSMADTFNDTDRLTVSFTRTANERFVTVPLDQLNNPCADEDGCQVRLSMSSYMGSQPTPVASTTALLFLNKNDGQWRINEPTGSRGTFGNDIIEHALSLFNKCYLTDGYYKMNTPSGDKNLGLSLMYFGPDVQKAGCSVTFID